MTDGIHPRNGAGPERRAMSVHVGEVPVATDGQTPRRAGRQRKNAWSWWDRAAAPVLGLVGIVLFLLLWQAAPMFGWVNPKFLPTALEVLGVFVQSLGLASFWAAVGHTMLAWAIGFSVSVVAGVILGLVIGSSGFLRKATHSTIEFLRPIPSVALIPLAVLLFGLRLESELLLIIYACLWLVLIQVLYGVADVDKVADDTARSMGLGTVARMRYLVWPTTLPYLVTGIRLTATVALILAITAELVIGTPGLGSEVAQAQSNNAIASMYALILTSGLIGVLVNLVMRLLEKKVLFWHTSVRGEVAL